MLNECRWKDCYGICKCGYSEYINQEVEQELCDSCIDNTNYEPTYEDTQSLLD